MLKEKIEKAINIKEVAANKRIEEENKQFQKEIDKLTPLLNELDVLKEYGFTPTLHTDKKVLPCPAIYIRNLGDYYSFYIGKDELIRADHHNSPKSFASKENFFDFIAKEIANRKVR